MNATDADCLLNNGRKHDFYLVPTDTEGAVTIAATIDGHPYAVRTTLPPMQAGSLVRLNLRKGKEGLAVNGSWVETRRKLRYQPVQRVVPWKWVTTCKKTVGYVLNVTAIQLPW